MSASFRVLQPGDVIGAKYAIVRTIGAGGMGIVYEAKHLRLGHRVAVKMLLPGLDRDEEAIARFDREARAAARIESQHVAHVFDVDALSDGTPYIVMEHLCGRDLADELAERGPLPVGVAVEYVLQACDAMSEAHRRGVIHRDLKPSNLFLAENGNKTLVKVLDFGISKILDGNAPSVTTTRSGLGTAVYMSPEQVRSAKHVDARSDVWALGVVLYEMLTGCQPFVGDTSTAVLAAIIADPPVPLRNVREAIPVELERVVMKALEKDRERRFRDAGEFAAAIAPFARAADADASPTSKSDSFEQRAARDEKPRAAAVPHVTEPGWTHANRARSVRGPTYWMLGLFAVGLISSILVLRELLPESRRARARPASQVLAPELPAPEPPPSARPSEPPPEEPPAPLVRLPASKPRPSTLPEPRRADAEPKSATENAPDPSPSTRPSKPLMRKNGAGLPDDPG